MDEVDALNYDNRINAGGKFFFFATFEVRNNSRIPGKNRQQPQSKSELPQRLSQKAKNRPLVSLK